MNEVDYEKMQERAAFGQFLLDTLAEHTGANEATEKSINRRVYKDTECGAWVQFNEEGVKVGTIVEGSEATYDEQLDLTCVDMSEEGATILRNRFDAALEACEEFARENFPCDEEEDDA